MLRCQIEIHQSQIHIPLKTEGCAYEGSFSGNIFHVNQKHFRNYSLVIAGIYRSITLGYYILPHDVILLPTCSERRTTLCWTFSTIPPTISDYTFVLRVDKSTEKSFVDKGDAIRAEQLQCFARKRRLSPSLASVQHSSVAQGIKDHVSMGQPRQQLSLNRWYLQHFMQQVWCL